MSASYATPRLTRSKSGADLLFEKLKYEQHQIDERAAIDYLNATLDTCLSSPLQYELKDGVLLCNLVNTLRPGTIKQIGQKDLSFIKMDNITRFLQGARQLGLSSSQLFETTDLFEARDMSAVVQTILAISKLPLKKSSSLRSLKKSSIEKKKKPVEEYRDVRDIFLSKKKSGKLDLSLGATTTLTRPPKSPLRSPLLSDSYSVHHLPSLMSEKSSSHQLSRSHSSITPSPIKRTTTKSPLAQEQQQQQQHDVEEKIVSYNSKDGSSTHYQLGNCIGKGQFGSVYRALDLATGETVAIKKICFQDGDDIDAEVMKEVALLKTLSHSNVIRFIGFSQSPSSFNIILEYAENGSLMSTLKAFGAFPEKLVASFCIKILNGLDYLHQNQVVHCDLKAANILTTKTGDVKLTDFGISLNLKIKGADTGSVSGTPNWMAPEVIELKGASTKSDIWSLGCTLVELVTGKPPYADMIAMSAMFRIVEDSCPPLPADISDNMTSFLKLCFQKDPKKRPSASELKQHPWIVQNQKLKKTETYAHDLNDYLEQSDITLNDDLENNESQVTLFEETIMSSGLMRNEEDYITHRFTHTSFGKVVECKVCGELMSAQTTLFCQVCGLLCHDECKKSAFSCPPKVNDQQPSYDWVFSAKIYNNNNNKRGSVTSTNSLPTQLKQEEADSIRHYALTLGLTPQEVEALSGNQALLSHALLLQQQPTRQKAATTRPSTNKENKKKRYNINNNSEECIIS